MDSTAAEILAQQALINRLAYQQRQIDEAQEENSSSIYLGYDASVGLHKIQDSEGNIFYAQSQTNGSVGEGETILIRNGYNGGISRYDAMPRVKKNVEANSSKKPPEAEAAILYYKDVFLDENTAPHYTGQWFYHGRVRKLLTQADRLNPDKPDLYSSREECESDNHLINLISSNNTPHLITYQENSIFLDSSFKRYRVSHRWVEFRFSIRLRSSFPTKLFLFCSGNINELDKPAAAVGLNKFLNIGLNQLVGNYEFTGELLNFNNWNWEGEVDLPENIDNIVHIMIVSWVRPEITINGAFTENFTGSINLQATWNPPPEIIKTRQYFTRSKFGETKLLKVPVDIVLKSYISFSKNKTFLNIFFWTLIKTDPNSPIGQSIQYRFLKKYELNGWEISEDIFLENPQDQNVIDIPKLDDDWLSPIFSWFIGMHTNESIIKSLSDISNLLPENLNIENFNINELNYYNFNLYSVDLNQTIDNQNLIEAVKFLRVKAVFKINNKTQKYLFINPIGENSTLVAVAVLQRKI